MAKHDQPALLLDNVHVHYGLGHVLQGVNLAVRKGEITAIVGRNGVGKTTTINTIMGLQPATEGQILFADNGQSIDLRRQPSYLRKKYGIALVPQGRRLFRSLTVAEHLNLTRAYSDRPFDKEAIYEIFPRLHERQRAGADTLSGGEQSMLAIARALILNPRLLLMDEPTEGLAPLLVQMIAEVIQGLSREGITVLLVEQKLRFALDVANQIAVMERGRIVDIYARDQINDVSALSELIMHGGR
ncbi:MAG: ABC transporter ATP-binding protein [Candidatus Promineifilaceae bacterium]|nr:ABC transporter ATP-binding protein [Candidatus Promineifilaceae bacterium]